MKKRLKQHAARYNNEYSKINFFVQINTFLQVRILRCFRIKVTGIRGRRCKQLVYGLKENRRCCKLKDEALNLTLWRNRSGRGYRPLVRHYMIMTKLPHTKTHLLKECSHASVQKQHGEDLNQQCTL